MNLELTKKELLPPLKTVASVIEDRRGGMLVLGNILLQADGDQLKLTGGDGDIEVTCNLPIETGADFALTIPKKLLDITRSLDDDDDLHISNKDDKLIIKSGTGKSRFTLATLSADDYPASPALDVKKQLTLPQSQLKSLIKQCAFCIASNDVRYYLNGLLLETDGSEAHLVATDGHRMAVAQLELPTSPVEVKETGKKSKKAVATETNDVRIIIPRKTIYELLKLLGDDGDVQIGYTDEHIRFILSDSLQITSKLIDGQYPDWQSVVPANATNIVTVPKATLYSALGRVTLLSNEKYKGVQLTLSENLLTVNAKNPNQEEATEEIEVDYTGEPLEIGFNGNYLLEAIAAVNTSNVQMAFTDSNSSVLITQNGDESVGQWIIMPMRL